MRVQIGNSIFDWGSKTYIAGIINLTPDSFSGDGIYKDPERAAAKAQELVEEGADLIDVGAESTRPGHVPISADEELERLLPSLRKIVQSVKVPVSVDTTKYEVAKEALEEGACIINDVWGLQKSPGICGLVASHNGAIIVMHNQLGTTYPNGLLQTICAFLSSAARRCLEAGVPPGKIIIDPGIGFGKNAEQNLQVLKNLDIIRDLGFPVLVGPSRKSFIGYVLGADVSDRIEGTAAAVATCALNGVDIVRVHDVKAMKRVCRMIDAIKSA